MITKSPSPPCSDLMQQWRQQIGQRTRLATLRGPRPFAVVSFQNFAPAGEPAIDLAQLTLVTVFDEWLDDDTLATRLVGVRGAVGPNGLQFGGPGLTRFDKNLRLAPAVGGRGKRVDAADRELLSLALQLEQCLERCTRHPYFPRRRIPQLPGLSPEVTEGWVSLIGVPKRQIISITKPAVDLCGRSGTASFDLYHSRFHDAIAY